DISGLVLGNFNDRFEKYMVKQLEEMVTFGMEPAKLLYGTDWPISSMESYLKFVNDMTIPNDARSKILGTNAIDLFKLDPAMSPYR
ncbi:MAG: amidohydrolase family protein, partial [Bdellovibrionales bacterium]|nr:amidohydrolase family protein [Bdellovibrionales bacterium]